MFVGVEEHESLLDALIAHRVSCAPHVLRSLVDLLGGDADTVIEVAQRLPPAQRFGMRPLPDPLPLVPAIISAFGGRSLVPSDRDLLLAVACCLDGRVEPVLEFDGRTAEEIVRGAVGTDLQLEAGRVRLVDPRLSIWIRRTSDAPTTTAVHERLSTVFGRRGDRVDEAWHRSRASLHGRPSLARTLVDAARELSEHGHSGRALMLATEAEKHSTGSDRDAARVVAGAAAVGAGFMREASSWLGMLYPGGAEGLRLQALAALLVAQTATRGEVPDVDPQDFRPLSDDPHDWHAWTRASAIAAGLCAERGDRRRMRSWLGALREGSSRLGLERDLRDPAVALSWLVSGDLDIDDVDGAGPISGGVLRALRAAVAGDIDLGLRVLATAGLSIGEAIDPVVAGFERSALVRAYRAVTEVLLLVWRGDIAVARSRLIDASVELPTALPFAGLGVVLARRLDLAVLGELSAFAHALTESLPPAMKIDLLVDRSIHSYLLGAFDEAASASGLWADLGAPQTTLAVPGLDEVLGRTSTEHPQRRLVRPPDLALAESLRHRLSQASDRGWRSEHAEVHEIARTLRSPFERARVEAMIGAQAAIRDDRQDAAAHLRSARSLFEVAGASAWARSMAHRLARLDVHEGGGGTALDSLGVCRRVWVQLLTERELDTAMRAVNGASNREIADALSISVRTVEVHLGRAFAKLGVRTRVELTVLAHRTSRHL